MGQDEPIRSLSLLSSTFSFSLPFFFRFFLFHTLAVLVLQSSICPLRIMLRIGLLDREICSFCEGGVLRASTALMCAIGKAGPWWVLGMSCEAGPGSFRSWWTLPARPLTENLRKRPPIPPPPPRKKRRKRAYLEKRQLLEPCFSDPAGAIFGG